MPAVSAMLLSCAALSLSATADQLMSGGLTRTAHEALVAAGPLGTGAGRALGVGAGRVRGARVHGGGLGALGPPCSLHGLLLGAWQLLPALCSFAVPHAQDAAARAPPVPLLCSGDGDCGAGPVQPDRLCGGHRVRRSRRAAARHGRGGGQLGGLQLPLLPCALPALPTCLFFFTVSSALLENCVRTRPRSNKQPWSMAGCLAPGRLRTALGCAAAAGAAPLPPLPLRRRQMGPVSATSRKQRRKWWWT